MKGKGSLSQEKKIESWGRLTGGKPVDGTEG